MLKNLKMPSSLKNLKMPSSLGSMNPFRKKTGEPTQAIPVEETPVGLAIEAEYYDDAGKLPRATVARSGPGEVLDTDITDPKQYIKHSLYTFSKLFNDIIKEKSVSLSPSDKANLSRIKCCSESQIATLTEMIETYIHEAGLENNNKEILAATLAILYFAYMSTSMLGQYKLNHLLTEDSIAPKFDKDVRFHFYDILEKLKYSGQPGSRNIILSIGTKFGGRRRRYTAKRSNRKKRTNKKGRNNKKRTSRRR